MPEKEEQIKRYHIIGGSFKKEKNAIKLVDIYKQQNYSTCILGKTNGLYPVSLGSCAGKENAIQTKNRIEEELATDTYILYY